MGMRRTTTTGAAGAGQQGAGASGWQHVAPNAGPPMGGRVPWPAQTLHLLLPAARRWERRDSIDRDGAEREELDPEDWGAQGEAEEAEESDGAADSEADE